MGTATQVYHMLRAEMLKSFGLHTHKPALPTFTSKVATFFLFFLPSHVLLSYYLRSSFSLSLLVVTQIRRHIAGSSLPFPLRFVPCIFIARRFELFLPSSTRVELCPPMLHALSSWYFSFFWQINSNSHHGEIRTHGPTLVAFEGYIPPHHRVDRLYCCDKCLVPIFNRPLALYKKNGTREQITTKTK